MGILSKIFSQMQTPSVTSILPATATQALMTNQLPILKTSRIFLKFGETCHYLDNAVYQKEKKVRVSTRNNGGYRMPGLFSGTSIYTGRGKTRSHEESEYVNISGTLFITNQRIIFSANNEGFEYELNKLTALQAYKNAVEIQFSNKMITIFVPNGAIVQNVLHQLK